MGPYDGSLFNIDSPGLELRQFTQADINDMKIIYMPPLSDIGDEDKFFSFKFVGMEAQYTYLSDDLSTLCINIHKGRSVPQ